MGDIYEIFFDGKGDWHYLTPNSTGCRIDGKNYRRVEDDVQSGCDGCDLRGQGVCFAVDCEFHVYTLA